ncbi:MULTISPECIES: cell division protein FtsL [unclassified Gemella]|uniref:cell division protein FtsL n=1 Tax=unclassified Gemella TaxID=2624949 RepID=UPI001C04878A|nr:MULTISPECIES: cell division protein FtsL [unclassified Gemella]MBU0278810.1 cell division protein FtsL [Gemella sp. zg-1178]QWQ39360.1 cell division protein FtsL [Gemella sp. zg-570]
MATLKVYSREYGVKKIEEKVSLTRSELTIYIAFPITVIVSIYIMLSYVGDIYSLRNLETKNNNEISKIESSNEEQRVIINDLSSYERVKKIAEMLGMASHKDNVKVVR